MSSKNPENGTKPLGPSSDKMQELAKSLIGKEAPPMPHVLPNLISIDGHQFSINCEGVPQAVTDKLDEIFDNGGTYDQIPVEVLQYELKGDPVLS
ncbi:uncharacterized protein N7503_000950 [Penicillium pulvis]|uniref:uncharacterized protein n=1 Tax=Penicillium pulvis TaxID=1562058 RepID=UPI0025474084|nr:uncharacterized protein N7503_000950 [Penicillium pulvis]KAJ5814200.1 hypothetical protein N7503_000950 [Penicillium pulvis]